MYFCHILQEAFSGFTNPYLSIIPCPGGTLLHTLWPTRTASRLFLYPLPSFLFLPSFQYLRFIYLFESLKGMEREREREIYPSTGSLSQIPTAGPG